VARYNAEARGIDVIMYRITDRAHADAMIAAVKRGVPVRLITEPETYRDKQHLWHAWNVDRMHSNGVQIKQRAHAGLNHQKSVLLQGQRTAIFGSSNWTTASDTGQYEHNMFTTQADLYAWFVDQLERKWFNTGGTLENGGAGRRPMLSGCLAATGLADTRHAFTSASPATVASTRPFRQLRDAGSLRRPRWRKVLPGQLAAARNAEPWKYEVRSTK